MSMQTDNVVYACLTHVDPWFTYPEYVINIYSGDAQGPGKLNLRDLAPEWEQHHPVLGGSAGAFAFKNYLLREHPGVKQVGVCQYRKFVSRHRIGSPAKNYQVMDVVSKCQVQEIPLHDELLSDHAFLIGKPGQFLINGAEFDYLYQYKDVHHVEDLLRFTAEAVAQGLISKNDVHPFFGEKIFFPGGVELGLFPADFWIETVTGIESVIRACVSRYGTRRDGVQARVWSFCMERLGSYLLIKHLRKLHPRENWLAIYGGQLNLVTEDDSADYVPGA